MRVMGVVGLGERVSVRGEGMGVRARVSVRVRGWGWYGSRWCRMARDGLSRIGATLEGACIWGYTRRQEVYMPYTYTSSIWGYTRRRLHMELQWEVPALYI